MPGRVVCHSLDRVATASEGSDRTRFTVESPEIAGRTVALNCSGGGRTFRETYEFPVAVATDPGTARVLDLLAAVAAVSYAKALAPCVVSAPGLVFTAAGRALVESAYGDGMAEFAHHTGIADPVRLDAVDVREDPPGTAGRVAAAGGGVIVPIGGGRDSCVVATALAPLHPMLLSIGGSDASRRVAAASGAELVVVDRTIDAQILEMNAAGAPNGHVPITAITMLASTVAAASLGAGCVVMANEASASYPTRSIGGRTINHQHSKSALFETLLHAALGSVGSPAVCVSALRNRSDTEIARVFARRCTHLHADFVSCNRANLRDESRRSVRWCGECPKCRSICLSLAPHMDPAAVAAIFGRDLLDDERAVEGFADLCHDERKPFECVQTVAEARASVAALAASEQWAGHRVVRALAPLAGPPVAPLAEPLGDHVPGTVRRAMEEFFS